MAWRNLQSVHVGQGSDRSRLKDDPLFCKVTDKLIRDCCDFFTTKNTNQRIDVRSLFEHLFFLPFSETTRDNHALGFSFALQFKHLIDRSKRFSTCVFNEAASVDDHKIAADRIGNQLVAIELQQAHHAFAVDCIFRAAKTDEGIVSFDVLRFRNGLKVSRQSSAREKVVFSCPNRNPSSYVEGGRKLPERRCQAGTFARICRKCGCGVSPQFENANTAARRLSHNMQRYDYEKNETAEPITSSSTIKIATSPATS